MHMYNSQFSGNVQFRRPRLGSKGEELVQVNKMMEVAAGKTIVHHPLFPVRQAGQPLRFCCGFCTGLLPSCQWGTDFIKQKKGKKKTVWK